jgi:hypothetical protein
MRKILLIALVLALTAEAAEARKRRHRVPSGEVTQQIETLRAQREALRLERDLKRNLDRNWDRNLARGDRRAARRGGGVPLAALIPRDWRREPSGPDSQGNRFTSPAGDAWLALSAQPADQDAREQHLKATAFIDGEDITYLRREPNWLVVSGLKGERIFYRKVVLACEGREWLHIAFEYPAEAKRALDPLVIAVSHRLDRTAQEDCDMTVGVN